VALLALETAEPRPLREKHAAPADGDARVRTRRGEGLALTVLANAPERLPSLRFDEHEAAPRSLAADEPFRSGQRQVELHLPLGGEPDEARWDARVGAIDAQHPLRAVGLEGEVERTLESERASDEEVLVEPDDPLPVAVGAPEDRRLRRRRAPLPLARQPLDGEREERSDPEEEKSTPTTIVELRRICHECETARSREGHASSPESTENRPDVKQSILQEVHEAAGAALVPDPDDPSPLLTYGEVPAEYAAAREDCVLLDETARGALRVTGADAADFLHRLLSNEVRALPVGGGSRQLLLSAKGKVLYDFALLRGGESEFHLSLPAGDAPGLAQALEMYHFAEALELHDETETHAPLLLLGPRAAERVEACLGVAPPANAYATAVAELGGGKVVVTRLSAYGSPALRLDAGPERCAELWSALREAGARPAGRIVADILRVEDRVALMHEDVDDGVYPQEARLQDAFSLDKGCYIGQEVVAKIDTYGGLNKLLCTLDVSHDDPLERGTRLYRHDEKTNEWRDLGMVTSWAYSFVSDTGRVLAYLKRKHTDAGIVFRIGEGPAEATVVEPR